MIDGLSCCGPLSCGAEGQLITWTHRSHWLLEGPEAPRDGLWGAGLRVGQVVSLLLLPAP